MTVLMTVFMAELCPFVRAIFVQYNILIKHFSFREACCPFRIILEDVNDPETQYLKFFYYHDDASSIRPGVWG